MSKTTTTSNTPKTTVTPPPAATPTGPQLNHENLTDKSRIEYDDRKAALLTEGLDKHSFFSKLSEDPKDKKDTKTKAAPKAEAPANDDDPPDETDETADTEEPKKEKVDRIAKLSKELRSKDDNIKSLDKQIKALHSEREKMKRLAKDFPLKAFQMFIGDSFDFQAVLDDGMAGKSNALTKEQLEQLTTALDKDVQKSVLEKTEAQKLREELDGVKAEKARLAYETQMNNAKGFLKTELVDKQQDRWELVGRKWESSFAEAFKDVSDLVAKAKREVTQDESRTLFEIALDEIEERLTEEGKLLQKTSKRTRVPQKKQETDRFGSAANKTVTDKNGPTFEDRKQALIDAWNGR